MKKKDINEFEKIIKDLNDDLDKNNTHLFLLTIINIIILLFMLGVTLYEHC